jgi:hypothetical protein
VNCKQGDLAMIVKTEKGQHSGMVVRCIRPFTGIFADGTPAAKSRYQWWVIDKEIQYSRESAAICPDRCLMPINPLDDCLLPEASQSIKEPKCE